MLQAARTSCTGMRMSDASRLTRSKAAEHGLRSDAGHAWLSHTGEVAQWTNQLLAWLWLGQQGQRLGWSLASGVLAVAVWWAARVLCRGTPWAFRCPSVVVGLLGALTALGVVGLGWVGASAGAWVHASLLALALVWGVWTALIETRSQVSSFQSGRMAWPPVLAAALLGLGWLGWRGLDVGVGDHVVLTRGVGFLLALSAAVLYARDRRPAGRARVCAGAVAGPQTLLAPSAMGLMMGTLWLGHDWCMGAGWSTAQVVTTHVALMAGLPALTAAVLNGALRVRPGLGLSPAAQEMSGLVLMALGALMWLGDSTAYGVLAMLLPSMAWALHCNRTRAVPVSALQISQQVNHPHVQRGLAVCLGPVLLVWVGVASAEQGPSAMQWALSVLGALAAICWVNKSSDFFAAKLKFEHLG